MEIKLHHIYHTICRISIVCISLTLLLSLKANAEPILVGDTWRYFKGTSEPPSNWNDIGFDDSAWLEGPTGIGYSSDVTYPTILDDVGGRT